MSIISCYSIKGGVGKTTTAVNIAYLSAKEGKRTLLWDLDLQGAASYMLSADDPRKKSHKILTDKSVNVKKQIQSTPFKNLFLLPADFSLLKADHNLLSRKKPKRALSFRLKELQKKYEHIIIDCSSGYTSLTRVIIKTTDILLTPVVPTPLSFETLDRLKKQVKKERKDDDLLVFPFFSMVDRRKALHKQILSLHQHGKRGFLLSDIPYSSKAEQMTVQHAPLPSFDSGSSATKAYKELWNEIKENVGLHDRAKRLKMW